MLLLAGTAGLPWYAVLTLPLLFSGGMMLCDSIDGVAFLVAASRSSPGRHCVWSRSEPGIWNADLGALRARAPWLAHGHDHAVARPRLWEHVVDPETAILAH